MLFMSIGLLGLISYTRIPQELFPSMEYPQITIVTKYEGAGPEEAEKLISRMVEETAGTVKDIKRVSSNSKEGVSIVTCEFRWGTNMDFAAMDVREKIDLIKESLPRDALEPVVLKYNPTQVEAMMLSVSYKSGEASAMKMAELRRFAKKNLKDELERLEGVAKVELRGGEEKEILVEIDKGRLLANQVSITEIITSLQNANITYPAGTIKEEKHEYLVKTVGEFQNIDDVADLSFSKADYNIEQTMSTKREKGKRQDSGEKIVFLRDIADIKESLKDRKGYSRYDGKENISVGIYQQSGSNLINLSNAVQKKLKDLSDRFPKDIEIKITSDQSDFIKKSLADLYSNGIQGILLSFILLYFFMKSFMASTIINIAIPVALCATLSMMYFQGITINTMSLGGLTVGIGMVVDNSNMVLENILMQVHRDKTREKKESIAAATKSLLAPIISSTFTSVAIFIPFVFVAGMIGQLFKQLALTITYSLISSISAAMFLVPRMALTADLSKQSVTAGMDAINKYFTPAFKKALDMRFGKVMLIVFIYTVVGVVCFALIPKAFMPKVDERRFVLSMSLPPDTPLEITNTESRKIEKLISGYGEVKDISVSVGSTGDSGGVASIESLGGYQARIIVRLKPAGPDGKRSTDEIVADIANEVRKFNIKGINTEFMTQQGLFGSGVGAASGLTIEVRGKDLKILKRSADEIRNVMENMPSFYGIKLDPPDEVPEYRLIIQRERASLFGLSTQDISAMTLAAIKGFTATKLKMKDDEMDIRVRMKESDRDTVEKIENMTSYSPWGFTIQLKQICDFRRVGTLPAIKRIEGERTYLITSNVKGNFTEATGELETILKERFENEDVHCVISGEMLAMKEALAEVGFALGLGVIIIFMILASEFESLFQPILVMTVVPLGLVGAAFSLFISGQSINAISMLGFIMLVGNVVNISILLIDRFNIVFDEENTKAEGKKINVLLLKKRIVKTTVDHIRPITMTTLTTITGLIPLALGFGGGESTNQPMAIAVVGGLSFALILSLIFVPYIYLYTKGMRNYADSELFQPAFNNKDEFQTPWN
jgi:HAE1 family hydrophobic/amphiphilic exporter-1